MTAWQTSSQRTTTSKRNTTTCGGATKTCRMRCQRQRQGRHQDVRRPGAGGDIGLLRRRRHAAVSQHDRGETGGCGGDSNAWPVVSAVPSLDTVPPHPPPPKPKAKAPTPTPRPHHMPRLPHPWVHCCFCYCCCCGSPLQYSLCFLFTFVFVVAVCLALRCTVERKKKKKKNRQIAARVALRHQRASVDIDTTNATMD